MPTWYQKTDLVVSGAPASAPLPTADLGDFYDPNGVWYRPATNRLAVPDLGASGSTAGELITKEELNSVNSRFRVKFSSAAGYIYLYSRFTAAGTGYGISLQPSTGNIGHYYLTSGSLGGAFTDGATTGSFLTDGSSDYWMQLDTEQGSGLTNFTFKLFAADGTTELGSATFSDTTAAAQDLSGGCGLFSYQSASTFAELVYYTDVPPAPDFTLAVTDSSGNIIQGGTATREITLTPLLSYTGTAELSVSGLPTGVTASFAPTSLVGGGTMVSTMTLTASGSATPGTSPVTVTGTDGALVHSTTFSLTVDASGSVTSYISDSNFFYPKEGWWYTAADNAGNGSIRTNCEGNYVKFRFTSTGTGNVVLVTDPAVNGHTSIGYAIDGGAWSFLNTVNGTANYTLFSGLSAGAHEVRVMLTCLDYNLDRWGSGSVSAPGNSLGIYGFTLPPGSTLAAPTTYYPIRPKRALFYGDSITEGVLVGTAASLSAPVTVDATAAWPALVGPALNAEYSIVGIGSQGYTHAGLDGITPPIYTPGNPAASAWDKYWFGKSRLSGGVFAANATEPLDYIASLHGTNDRGADQPTVTVNAQGLIGALKAAAPTALILMCVPPGLYTPSGAPFSGGAITDAVTNYLTANPSEMKVRLVNIARNGNSALNDQIAAQLTDTLHPNATGQLLLAMALGGAILNSGAVITNTVYSDSSFYRQSNYLAGDV